MVLRRDADGVLAVGQASHAWLCGQMARSWGNERFGSVVPLDDVALGAEQHDVGMAAWDLEPARDPETGLPQSFMSMGAEVNASLWRTGPIRLVTQSRYAALLATMHGRRLYERFDLATAAPDEARVVRAFLGEAREQESALLASLRADPAMAAHATPESVARNSGLIWTWDALSLALLLDWAPLTLTAGAAAEAAPAPIEIAVRTVAGSPADGVASVTSLSPWPFTTREARIELRCEGRRLTGDGYASQAELNAAWREAPWETVRFTLISTDP